MAASKTGHQLCQHSQSAADFKATLECQDSDKTAARLNQFVFEWGQAGSYTHSVCENTENTH